MRAFGTAASGLAKDLGMDDNLRVLKSSQLQTLKKDELEIVDELLSYLQ
jgi:uncharacterized protein YdcH (DUF465 family)